MGRKALFVGSGGGGAAPSSCWHRGKSMHEVRKLAGDQMELKRVFHRRRCYLGGRHGSSHQWVENDLERVEAAAGRPVGR